MTTKKFTPVFLVLTMLTLSACSSSSGGGASQPSDVNVIVPPNSIVTVPPDSK